jgi:anti-anti-sigma factor
MGADEGIVWYLRAAEEDLGQARLVVLEGRISNATAPQLESLLDRPPTSGAQAVIVDLAGVDYINGAGLRVFQAAAARHNGSRRLVVCGLRPAVAAAFRLVGSIPQLITVETRDDALDAARAENSPSR